MKTIFIALLLSCLSVLGAHPSQLQGVQYSLQRVRNPYLWIDTSDPTTLTFDATLTNVIQINDKSGFGLNLLATNGTAQVPIQLPGINGLSSVYFGLTSTCMQNQSVTFPAYISFLISGGFTIKPWVEEGATADTTDGVLAVGNYLETHRAGGVDTFTGPAWPTNFIAVIETYGGSRSAVYWDGVSQSGSNGGSQRANTNVTAVLNVGARNNGAGGISHGYWQTLAVWTNIVLSANDIAYLSVHEDRRMGVKGIPIWLSCEGDSITQGLQASTAVKQYVNLLGGYLPARFSITNYGVAGYKIPQMTTNAAAHSCISVTNFYRGISLSSIGVNDANGGTNGPTMYTNLITYYQQQRAAGFSKVVGCTLYELGGTATVNSNVTVCNALLRSNWVTYLDALVDLASDARLTNNHDTTYYNADTLHPNNNGHAVMAYHIGKAIAALGL